ncbi:MAG: phosphoenolpyruvate carboxykinase [Alphaproteobacteria bacterium]|nr:phosphoenolpyruvate carboxykinase [Alphaproteobacteria bacterium]HRW28970.1 phosphoenolpyruvate carboxykinase [Emcibacteraceae bacterium]
MNNVGKYVSSNGVENQKIKSDKNIYWNFGTELLYEHTIKAGLGHISKGGALVVETGQHTGRSANDKFMVDEPSSRDNIWWGKVNKAISEENFNKVEAKIIAYLNERDLYVQDLYGGTDPAHRISVRTISPSPWHSLFIRNLLVNPKNEDLKGFKPDFTILHAPELVVDPKEVGTNSGTVVTINIARKLVLIAGTSYAGEIKKSVFSILNYLLPEEGILPMHCSANIGKDGDTAIFFGLSGTGKTTLSADPQRQLIGDDEHGWSDNSVFNFEGGCYAKVINLSAEAEPEIYATTSMFGTVLENVIYDPDTREIDLNDNRLAENTRAAYPITSIPNTTEGAPGSVPKNVIMLTADAFGVMPPIARLTPEQAMYHFLSGYTAKVAGTEKGLSKEPQATFSTCFGAPFMPRHPSVYGNLLRKKIAEGNVTCWLVNTGWTGGVYGVGSRMPIKYTRALLHAALDGSLNNGAFRIDPNFGFEVPLSCPGVDTAVLDPRGTWADVAAYDKQAAHLVGLFKKNFVEYEEHVDDAVRSAGPIA